MKCLTPEKLTGRIYFLTNYGRRLVWRVFATAIDAEEQNFDWNKYSRVLAGKTRKHFLLVMYRLRGFYPDGIGLAVLRKRLGNLYPLTLSQAFSTVRDLQKEGLTTISGHARKRSSKLYRLTSEGVQIVEYILQNTQKKS
ncbi:MAG: hypothetical protein PHH77_12870 [Victivallaceae bacterium]|nr:hypothetical protein [Victivallaceae bacterium]